MLLLQKLLSSCVVFLKFCGKKEKEDDDDGEKEIWEGLVSASSSFRYIADLLRSVEWYRTSSAAEKQRRQQRRGKWNWVFSNFQVQCAYKTTADAMRPSWLYSYYTCLPVVLVNFQQLIAIQFAKLLMLPWCFLERFSYKVSTQPLSQIKVCTIKTNNQSKTSKSKLQ